MKGFYLKSASGRLSAYFVYELVSSLYKRFPDQDITIHAHSTFGEAPVCYMAAALAAVELDKDITMDVQFIEYHTSRKLVRPTSTWEQELAFTQELEKGYEVK